MVCVNGGSNARCCHVERRGSTGLMWPRRHSMPHFGHDFVPEFVQELKHVQMFALTAMQF